MLFAFQFLEHKINKVSEIPEFFLGKSLTESRYSDSLFPDWFKPVISNLPGLNSKFENVFKEIKKTKKLNKQALQELHNNLVAGANISNLCKDIILVPPKTISVSNDLHESLKVLFKYFFEVTLKESKTLFDALETTYNDHYKTFRTTNLGALGKVCPMCGIHEYPLSANEPKAQYDHWLPQDSYPLFGISFFNLIPICGYCNNIKLSQDLLFDTNARTVCFYPYQAHGGISLNIVNYTPVDALVNEKEKEDYKYGKHEIELTPIDPNDQLKISSWNRVFGIKNRYATYLSDYYEEIKQSLKEYTSEKGWSFSDGNDKNALVDALKQYEAYRIKDIRRETGSHLKKAYLSFICNDGNEHLLYTLFGLRSIAA